MYLDAMLYASDTWPRESRLLSAIICVCEQRESTNDKCVACVLWTVIWTVIYQNSVIKIQRWRLLIGLPTCEKLTLLSETNLDGIGSKIRTIMECTILTICEEIELPR